MTVIPFDTEEQEILTAFEADALEYDNEEKSQTVQMAKDTLSKRRSITLRIPEQDLYRLKIKSIQKGIPYQTLIVSLLHEYSKQKKDFPYSSLHLA